VITVYGIKNCDSCRKALKWLNLQGIEHTFHDFRKDGLDKRIVNNWIKELGIEELLNRRGTTWRKLSAKEQDEANTSGVTNLLLENPTLIKRPVMDLNSCILVGFKEETQITLKSYPMPD